MAPFDFLLEGDADRFAARFLFVDLAALRVVVLPFFNSYLLTIRIMLFYLTQFKNA
jgi:hypothetical protein